MLAIILAVENDEDREFLSMIFDEYYPTLYCRAYSIMKNRTEAQDCAIATIETAVEYVEKFKKAYDENWLIKLLMITCRNICYNRYNYNKKRRDKDAFTTIDDPLFESKSYKSESYAEDVERILINEYTVDLVYQLIKRLDVKYRDVIFFKQRGYEYDQIADMLGISVELARKRYQRAKEQILLMGGEELYDVRKKR